MAEKNAAVCSIRRSTPGRVKMVADTFAWPPALDAPRSWSVRTTPTICASIAGLRR